MRPPRFAVVPAVYLVLIRESDNAAADPEVLLQLRTGTRFMDGRWACGAAGQVEAGESMLSAAVREADEELGIELNPYDLELVATLHRTVALPDPVEQRVDVFLGVRHWVGQPHRAEPAKCAELRWWPLSGLPEKLVPHERLVLEQLAAGHGPAILSYGFDQRLILIAAVGRNRVIGDGTDMPWHLPDDLRFFKQTTTGGVLVMGRGTWDSIGRALPGRRTIVVTRQAGWSAPGTEVAHSIPEALCLAGDGDVFIAGGGELYAQTIPHAHRLLITEVDLAPPGGVRFPQIDGEHWQQAERRAGTGDITAWVTWERLGQ